MEIINARMHLNVCQEKFGEVGMGQRVGVIPKVQKDLHVELQKERKEWLNIMNIAGIQKHFFIINILTYFYLG